MQCVKCKTELPDNAAYCLSCGAKQAARPRSARKRGNGEGTVYKRENGKWQAEICIYRNGKRMRKYKGGFAKKKDALDYIVRLKNQKAARSVITLDKIWDGWSETALPKLSDSKQVAYKIAHKKLSDLRYWDIADIKISDLQEMVDNAGTSYYTCRDMKSLLSHLYKRAVAQQDVLTNLALFIELPTLDAEEPTPFNEDELRAFWSDYGNGNTFTGYILLMIYSGMMPGELLKAEKGMIDWGKQLIFGCGMKTKKRKETPIVIADFMIPVLADLCENSETDKIVNIKKNRFYDLFKDTLQRCRCRPLAPYSCRHTTATALALGNISPSVIQAVMRHSKLTTTQHYIHVDSKPMLDAVNLLVNKKDTTDKLPTKNE